MHIPYKGMELGDEGKIKLKSQITGVETVAVASQTPAAVSTGADGATAAPVSSSASTLMR
jgi:hypothetical protein